MASNHSHDRFHGRIGGSGRQCAHRGCTEAGEFRAPDPEGHAATHNGPGDYQYLCVDHIREFNAGYNWFDGMTAEEIFNAQSPLNIWPSETRAFRPNGGVDSPPKWADFKDPLEAISARFRDHMPKPRADGHVLSPEDRRALKTLGLGEDADRRALRQAYSTKVRTYHPDKNGGNRSYEKALQDVIAAYTHLKKAAAFA
ncbi:MAG: J domain-containing protein [Sphingomonadaceae bacterium]|nr:J domain-containing protein [Sphingomonadaceae bacterium]